LVLPARSRAPAITGALASVLIVVINGDRPLRRICFPAILVCPCEGRQLGFEAADLAV
jgi:hypothetical protein